MDVLAGAEPASLQARLERAEPRPRRPDAASDDPAHMFERLVASGHFHRDTGLGRLFHPGSVSLRENRPTDSLHIVIHHDHIAAHVDRISPLAVGLARAPRYSVRRAAAHNLAGMAHDALRLLRGRQGDHRSGLDCRWMWDGGRGALDPAHLLDPADSSW
ncbi:MAG: hypothetical protein M3N98_11995, partial [Actinomycetota bacterium]|nr:hypothetical protein [Actinomycetota bacterium]